jgi:hypothetical protein
MRRLSPNFDLDSVSFPISPPFSACPLGPLPDLTRFTRAELTEVLTSDFMLARPGQRFNERSSDRSPRDA